MVLLTIIILRTTTTAWVWHEVKYASNNRAEISVFKDSVSDDEDAEVEDDSDYTPSDAKQRTREDLLARGCP